MEAYCNLLIEDVLGEIWKDIEGYESLYKVSNFGRIKSLKRIYRNCISDFYEKKESILKQSITKKGYLAIGLIKEKKVKRFSTHRLVANAFIVNETQKAQVNHINSLKKDNRIDNLEWVSNRENHCHKFDKSKTSSIYIGVYYAKKNKKWKCQIRDVNNKVTHLGYFFTQEEAYKKRVQYEKENKIDNKYL